MNERERRFCEEYLVDLCASRAALRAGYAAGTAKFHASEWINPRHPAKPELRAEIDRLLADRALRTRVSADRVVRELAGIAFSGEGGAEEARGLAPPEEAEGNLPRDDGAPGEPEASGGEAAGAKARPKRGGRTKDDGGVRTQDRLRALELLGKHLGMFAGNLPPAQQARPVIVDEIDGEEESGGE